VLRAGGLSKAKKKVVAAIRYEGVWKETVDLPFFLMKLRSCRCMKLMARKVARERMRSRPPKSCRIRRPKPRH